MKRKVSAVYVPKEMLNRTSSILSKIGEAIIQIFEY